MAFGRLPSIWLMRMIAMLALLVAFASVVSCKRESPEAASVPIAQDDPAAIISHAEGGDAQAQCQLGELHARGLGAPVNFTEAAHWYSKAAEQGYAPAQHSLGELFEAGQGVPQDDLKAAELYRKAAEQGHSGAAYNLAVLYAFGRGVPLNEGEAVRWYRRAADLGEALAQFNLGQRFQKGKGVERDPVEAYKWLALAAESIADSAKERDELGSSLTRKQLGEARQRIAAFVNSRKPD
jgi:TPR repeat protein